MSATDALVDMTAECSGTTPRNGQQHFDVPPAKPMTVSFYESISRSADDVGHLQRRPAHLVFVRRLVVQCQRVQRTRDGVEALYREVHVKQGVFQIFMTEQDLNGAEIRASLV